MRRFFPGYCHYLELICVMNILIDVVKIIGFRRRFVSYLPPLQCEVLIIPSRGVVIFINRPNVLLFSFRVITAIGDGAI